MSAPIVIGCLLTGGVLGWLSRRPLRGSRAIGLSADPSPSSDRSRSQPSDGEELAAFSEIRSELSQHFELLNEFVTRMPATGNEECDAVLLHDAEALTKKLALVYDDIRRLGDRLPVAEDARIDLETATGNRLALEEWLQMHFAYLSRYGNEFSVALFEIESQEDDGEVASANSELIEVGQNQAGAAPCQLTDLLMESIRGTDKVFRYSANEFVVALPETPLEGAIIFADRAVQEAKTTIGCRVFGGATAARHSDSLRTLMNRADSALYEAKSEGENSVCFHDGQRIGSAAEVPYEPIGPRT